MYPTSPTFLFFRCLRLPHLSFLMFSTPADGLLFSLIDLVVDNSRQKAKEVKFSKGDNT